MLTSPPAHIAAYQITHDPRAWLRATCLNFSRRRTAGLLAAALALFLASSSAASAAGPVRQLPAVQYTAIDGHTETLIPWQGDHVSVLVEPGVDAQRESDDEAGAGARPRLELLRPIHRTRSRDRALTERSRRDRGGDQHLRRGLHLHRRHRYRDADLATSSRCTSRSPEHNLSTRSRSTSSAAASGSGARSCSSTRPIRTRSSPASQSGCAFARCLPLASAERRSTAPRSRRSPLRSPPLAGQYEADPSLTFAETLAEGQVAGSLRRHRLLGVADDAARHRHGGQTFVKRFWQHAGALPAASSTTGAVTNWVQDANYAACTDLSSVFYTRWGFPRPDGSVTDVLPRRGARATGPLLTWPGLLSHKPPERHLERQLAADPNRHRRPTATGGMAMTNRHCGWIRPGSCPPGVSARHLGS